MNQTPEEEPLNSPHPNTEPPAADPTHVATQAAMAAAVARLTPHAPAELYGDLAIGPKRAAVIAVDAAAPILLAAGRAQATAATIDADHLDRQRAFSARTFGPGPRTAGILDHIRKEMTEIKAAPDDLGEWADLIILGFDGAWRAGHEPQDIIDAIKAKQARNEARRWPDWRTAEPSQAIEHDRTGETTA